MARKNEAEKMIRPPDLDWIIREERKHEYATYAKGARMYDLNYWTFVNLAKEAGAAIMLRGTPLVDLGILDTYMDKEKRTDDRAVKGVIMAKKSEIQELDNLVKKGKKYMRSEEAMEFFSVGRHTMEKWAKQAKAIYKINGVKLLNIEKIERFIEAFEEEEE